MEDGHLSQIEWVVSKEFLGSLAKGKMIDMSQSQKDDQMWQVNQEWQDSDIMQSYTGMKDQTMG